MLSIRLPSSKNCEKFLSFSTQEIMKIMNEDLFRKVGKIHTKLSRNKSGLDNEE